MQYEYRVYKYEAGWSANVICFDGGSFVCELKDNYWMHSTFYAVLGQ